MNIKIIDVLRGSSISPDMLSLIFNFCKETNLLGNINSDCETLDIDYSKFEIRLDPYKELKRTEIDINYNGGIPFKVIIMPDNGHEEGEVEITSGYSTVKFLKGNESNYSEGIRFDGKLLYLETFNGEVKVTSFDGKVIILHLKNKLLRK